jgi:transposase-like protein
MGRWPGGARAQHAGGDGSAPARRRRMSAKRKQSAVLRLLRGEDLELVSRELGVTAAELSAWRDAFLAGGEESLKTRPADGRDVEIGRLKAKVGDHGQRAAGGQDQAPVTCSPWIPRRQ